MAEAYTTPPKFDAPAGSTDEEKLPETSTSRENPPAAPTNGENPLESKEKEPPIPAEKDEAKSIEEEKPKDPPASNGTAADSADTFAETLATAAESEIVKNALLAPLPPEFTTGELIEQRRNENGLLYACCFAVCCCPLCYEGYEFILEYLCCQRKEVPVV